MSAEVAAWRAAQKERAATDTRAGAAARSSAAVLTYVPEGQAAVPWHQISDFRITDSLVARVNYSNGNLMLAATDFDVAGVGQPLRLARTYNSLDAPWGKVSQRWWQEYERYAQIFTSEVVIYDASGKAVRFTKETDGTFTTPKGYSKEKAVIDRPHGRDITITAPAADATHTYVDAVSVDGRVHDRSWTDASLLGRGGKLVYRLSEKANTSWATAPSGLPR